MQNFINTFGELCEFSFIEGRRDAKEKPIQYFVDMGITPPFKSWMSFKYQPYRSLPDGHREIAITKAQSNVGHVIESTYHLIDYMNRQDEAFDGFAGFSQGNYQINSLMKTCRYFNKQLNMRHRMPFFVIDFNGPKFDWLTYHFLQRKFVSGDIFVPNCESLHFKSDKDQFY